MRSSHLRMTRKPLQWPRHYCSGADLRIRLSGAANTVAPIHRDTSHDVPCDQDRDPKSMSMSMLMFPSDPFST